MRFFIMNFTSTENIDLKDAIRTTFRQLAIHLINGTTAEGKTTSDYEARPNHRVLNYPDGLYPKTLFELGSTSWYLDIDAQKSGTWKDWFALLRNMGFLSEVRHGGVFNESLPPIGEAPMENVYLVCGRNSMVIEGFHHWTVLSQGHYFHLKAGKHEPENASHQTSLAEEFTSHTDFFKRLCLSVPGAPISKDIVAIPDVSTPLPQDQRKRKKALTKYIAYNVGKTSYTPSQIDQLSDEILRHMETVGRYSLFLNNCQHFAQTLVRRVVMVQRDPKAVCGTLSEISAWDQGNDHYRLRKWLTKTKALLLLLPVRKSLTAPESLTRWSLFRPMRLRGWPEEFEHWVFKGELKQILEAIRQSDNPVRELKNQFRERVKPYQGYAEYDDATVPIIATVIAVALILTSIIELIGWTGLMHLATSAAATSAAIGTVPAVLPTDWKALFILVAAGSIGVTGLFVVLHLIVTRTLFARGSLSVEHYDIVASSNWRERLRDLRRDPLEAIFVELGIRHTRNTSG